MIFTLFNNPHLKAKFFRSFIFLSIIIIIIKFPSSFARSIANVIWFKQVVPQGVDYRLYFPFGECSGEHSKALSTSSFLPAAISPYFAGLENLNNDEMITAEKKLLQALAEGVTPDSSAYVLGIVQILQGKNADSLFTKSRASKRWLILGKECVVAGNLELADTYYKMALNTIDSKNVKGYQQLVQYFAGSNDEEAFNQALQTYLSIADPDSLDYLWTMGKTFASQDQPSRAIEFYQAILEKTPQDPQAWYYAGQQWVKLENYSQAQYCFSQAVEINPNSSGYYVYMGHTYLYQQHYEQAGKWYEKALSVDPESDWAMTNLAEIRIQQKRYQEALELAVRAMEFDARPHVRALASRIALLMGDGKNARLYIEEAISLDPENIEYLLKLVEVCNITNDQSCIKNTSQLILKIDPNNAEAQRILSEISGEIP